MEQLLNLLWLMLVLPAFFVWRFQLSRLRSSRTRHSSRSFVLLGCLLVLLFPVVSASDDLHPISAEVEESGPFKRTLKQSPGIKSDAWSLHGGGAALATRIAAFLPDYVASGVAPEYLPVLPGQVFVSGNDSRAPPAV
jgi:hypothetical protein